LLTESVCVTLQGVSKHVACFVQDGKLVALVEFTALVPPDQSVIDKCSVTGKVFEDSNDVSALLLVEQETMSVRDCRRLQDAVCKLRQ
jgi:hypothetical protein